MGKLHIHVSEILCDVAFPLCFCQDSESELRRLQEEKTRLKLEVDQLRSELNERRRQSETVEQVRDTGTVCRQPLLYGRFCRRFLCCQQYGVYHSAH